jgi:hypothetical protein
VGCFAAMFQAATRCLSAWMPHLLHLNTCPFGLLSSPHIGHVLEVFLASTVSSL